MQLFSIAEKMLTTCLTLKDDESKLIITEKKLSIYKFQYQLKKHISAINFF